MSLSSEFEFNLLPTGIGSLPHLNADKACELVLENFTELPFWPQLPKLGFRESMYVQFAYDLPCVSIDTEAKKLRVDLESRAHELESFYEEPSLKNYDREHFAGFNAMLDKFKSLKTKPKFIKGQLTGPISLGLQLVDSSGKSILYNKLYFELLVKALNLKAKFQEQKLSIVAKEVIIFFDEPSLSMFGTPYLNLSREEIISALTEVCQGVKCLKGVHCCGNTDWSLILELPIDIISFDAYNYAERLALYSRGIKNFLARGGCLAFGIVPSVEDNFRTESLDSLVSRFEHVLHYFIKKDISEKELLRSSLITPSCGLGTMSAKSAAEALKMTKELAELLRKRYGLA